MMRRATLSALSVQLADPESTTSPGSVGRLQLAGPGCSIAVGAHVARPLRSPGGKPTKNNGQLMGAIQLTKLRALTPTRTHTHTHAHIMIHQHTHTHTNALTHTRSACIWQNLENKRKTHMFVAFGRAWVPHHATMVVTMINKD